jgi:hypothetical protein
LPLKTLPAGMYTGTFTLQLCKDPGCAAVYPLTGGSLSYRITITPQVTTTATATIKINDVVQAVAAGPPDVNGAVHYVFSIPTGATLELDTSIAMVSWSYVTTFGAPTVTPFPLTSFSVFRATVALSVPSLSTVSTIRALAADGQAIYFDLTVH